MFPIGVETPSAKVLGSSAVRLPTVSAPVPETCCPESWISQIPFDRASDALVLLVMVKAVFQPRSSQRVASDCVTSESSQGPIGIKLGLSQPAFAA